MQRQRLRLVLSMVALGVAVLVCVQVGVIRVTEDDRNTQLADELASLRNARGEEVARLRAELDRLEGEAQRLRSQLASATTESSTLETALELADEARDKLAARVGALSDALDGERPSLDVHLAPNASPRTLAAIAGNRGEQPLAIRESRGWLWVDGSPLALDGSFAPAELSPGGAVDVFEFDPRSRALEFVPDSNAPVRGALCFVYGSLLLDGAAPWVEERWFEYRPADGIAATVRSDSWPLADGAIGCQLDASDPPW